MLDLITDRTKADADAAEALYSLLELVGWDGLSTEQKAFWDNLPRGTYNHTDLSRVEAAIQYLEDVLNQNGYWPWLTTKADWSEGYTPTPGDLDRYIQNIHTLRSILPTLPGTPEAPATMDKLNWQGANDIEKILLDIETVIERMVVAFWYMGELFMGEVME